MKHFKPSPIVTQIWSTADIVLFIFAGGAAEFALNREVDWLYHTGKLPANPIGRLFSTVRYAQQIILNNEDDALAAINRINKIHQGVESSRGYTIPEHAYQDVLYMLIHYSIACFELLERKLSPTEKDDIVHTFSLIGTIMNLNGIPDNYVEWTHIYPKHLQSHLVNSAFTKDLFKQYKKHLGVLRYLLVLEIQRLIVPGKVNELLQLGNPTIGKLGILVYRKIRRTSIRSLIMKMLIPVQFKEQLIALQRYELLDN